MDVSPRGSGTLRLENRSNGFIAIPETYPETFTCFFSSNRVYATATANTGFVFDHWTLTPQPSGFNTTANPTNFINDEPRNLVAYFRRTSGEPLPPQGISASDGTFNDKIRITWNASSGAASYEIYRAGSLTEPKILINSINSSTLHDDFNITCGNTYYYWIKAVNSSGTSAFSASDSGYCKTSDPVDPDPPEPPPTFTPTNISIADAKKIMDENKDLIIVDVSTKTYFVEDHLFCAVNLTWNTQFHFINYNLISEYKDHEILIYDHNGAYTRIAAEFLAGVGFSSVYYFNGGLDAWRNAGFSLDIVPTSCKCEICGLPPMALAGKDQTVEENETVVLDASGSTDPKDRQLTYAWKQFSGPEVVLDDASRQKPSFMAPHVQEGGASLVFHLTVTNPDEEIDQDRVNIHVVWTSHPPAANAGFPQTVVEGDNVLLDGSGSTDIDDGIKSYLWELVDGPGVELTGADTATAGFEAPEITVEPTMLRFRLMVTDHSGKNDTDTVDITVKKRVYKPVADAGGDATVIETHTATLDGTASSHPGGGAIRRYEWTQLDGPTVTIDNDDKAKASFAAPSVDMDKPLIFQLFVYDDAGQASEPDEVTVTIQNVGEVPIAHAGASQTVYEGALVALDASLSRDSDGTITSYQWRQLSGSEVALSASAAMGPEFIAPPPGANPSDELVFELTVTDDDGLSSTDRVSITIKPSLAPTADAGPDQTVGEKEMVLLDGTASTDPDDGIKSYFWSQTGGTIVTLSDPGAVNPEFPAPEIKADEDLTFALTVEDFSGKTDTDEVRITVLNKSSGGSGCFITTLEK